VQQNLSLETGKKKPFKLLLLLLLVLPPTNLKTTPILLSSFQHKTWQNKTEEANTNKRREKREESYFGSDAKTKPKTMKARGKKKPKKTPHLGPFSTEFVLHKKNINCNESSKCMQRRNLQTKKNKKKNQTKQQ
jgi:hypothetical protein